MNRIKKAFQNPLTKIVYTTCGYPDLTTTEKIILELEKAGIDIIELGFPFSDPMADGPTIQTTSQIALNNHYSINDYFKMIKNIRKKTQIPLIIMTYANIIYHYGYEKMIRDAKNSGIDGFIIPDLELNENIKFGQLCSQSNLANIMIASENTSKERLNKIISHSTGFIYVLSQPGITGSKLDIQKSLITFSQKLKNQTTTPLSVGFGISSKKDVDKLKPHFNGIIVGSAFLKPILEHKGQYTAGIKLINKIFK